MQKSTTQKTAVFVGFAVIILITLFLFYRGKASAQLDKESNAASMLAREITKPENSEIAEASEKVRTSVRSDYTFSDFFSAKHANDAMSLLPQITNIDPQTRLEMISEISALCRIDTSKLSKELSWLSSATNDYCSGFTPISQETVTSQWSSYKTQQISNALGQTLKKEGAGAVVESIKAVITTSSDPYERSGVLVFAAENNIKIDALGIAIGASSTSQAEIKDTLWLAAHMSFCRNNAACSEYGVRSLTSCFGMNVCKKPTPFLDQLRLTSSPNQYSAAQELVEKLEGKKR